MTTASDATSRRLARLAIGLWAAASLPAYAAAPATATVADPGEAGRGLFSFGYMGAYDYILLAVALIVGIATGILYYRSTLLESVKRMQKPSKVKLRSIGLGLSALALLLLLAPALPVGVLLIIVVAGLVIALAAGLGLVAAGVVVVIAAILVGLWFSGALGNMLGG